MTMTLLEEAKAHMEKRREHTDCCGVPVFRRMVAELERLQDEAAQPTLAATLGSLKDEFCNCACHTDPNVVHVAPCCGKPPAL